LSAIDEIHVDSVYRVNTFISNFSQLFLTPALSLFLSTESSPAIGFMCYYDLR
jgi:hypothetical protein